MPRLNVIILTQNSAINEYTFAMWADVPTARQPFYANTNAKSAWASATATDNQNLQNGSVVEQVGTARFNPATALPAVQANMQAQWQAFQTSITNSNPWIRYGSTWDGTSWVLTGVS